MNNSGKMSTGWIILIVLIIIVGGYLLIASDNVDSPEDATTDEENVSTSTSAENIEQSGGMIDGDYYVSYTEEGFAPESIEIPLGDTVTFVNNSESQDMWVASAVHPTHEAYSDTTMDEHCQDDSSEAFDACVSIPAGESWSFTFNKAGEWTYHNHVSASHTGTVVVE